MRRRVDVVVEDTKKSAYDFGFSGLPKSTADDMKKLLDDEEKKRLREQSASAKTGGDNNCGLIACGIVSVILFGAAVVGIVLLAANSRATMDMTPTNTTNTTTTMMASVTEPPALVTAGTPAIEVSFVCNHVLTGVDAGFCLGVFSYNNPTGSPITVPIGANNYMTPGPIASSHPTHFVAGLRYGAVTSRWRCSVATSLSWVVRSGDGVSVATTSAAHHECPPLPL